MLTYNKDIFNLDTINNDDNIKVFIVASITDTIKNSGYYELLKIIKNRKSTRDRTIFINRLITEEEDYVLKCKKGFLLFEPENNNWSSNFLNGLVKPYTEEYQILEKNSFYYRKSIDIFVENCTIFPVLD